MAFHPGFYRRGQRSDLAGDRVHGAHGRNKDGDYTYHHCAELQIRANPNKPIDTRFPAENKQR